MSSEAAVVQLKPWDSAARSIETAMRFSSALLVLAGYMALAATEAHSAAIILIPVILLAFTPGAEWLDGRTKVYRYLMLGVTLLFGLCLPLLVRVLGLLEAVVVLVVFIQGHKLLHVKRARDYYQIYLMAFFMLVAACAQDAGAAIGLVLAFFLVSAVWAFIMRQVQTEAAANESWATADLVDVGVRDSVEPLGARRFVDRNLVISVMGLSVACIFLTILLFVSMPRFEAGLLGGTGSGFDRSSQATTGLGRGVNVAEGGTITRDLEPAMRVEFPDEPGNQYGGPLYWRQTTYDAYWGAQWRRLGIHGAVGRDSGSFEFTRPSSTVLTRTAMQKTRTVRQKIFLEDVDGKGLPPFSKVVRGGVLPALSLVNTVTAEGARLVWSPRNDFTVIAAGTRSGLAYEAESEVLDVTPQDLRRAGGDYGKLFLPVDLRRLTRHDLEPRTVELARELTQDADTVYDKVSTLETWLSGGLFVYTLELPALPLSHPIDAFIHDVRRGHCQRFATALAQMVRSLGIPARVVSGYRGGEWFPGEKAYIVRRDMAHLWVEVYIAGHGWVTFDPSPPSDWDDPLGGGSAIARLRRFMSRQTLVAKMFWYQSVVGYRGKISPSRVRDLLTAVLPFWEKQEGPGREQNSAVARVLRLAGVVLVAAGLIAMVWVVVIRRRGRPRGRVRKGLTPDQKRALRVYQQLRRRLSRHGARCAGQTAGEILVDVIRSGLVPAEPVRRVVEAYNAARFGGGALSRSEYSGLTRTVRALRRSDAKS
jgi:protein-glutamine gamma-glutamyltransferase